jgi:hypothetical protein
MPGTPVKQKLCSIQTLITEFTSRCFYEHSVMGYCAIVADVRPHRRPGVLQAALKDDWPSVLHPNTTSPSQAAIQLGGCRFPRRVTQARLCEGLRQLGVVDMGEIELGG